MLTRAIGKTSVVQAQEGFSACTAQRPGTNFQSLKGLLHCCDFCSHGHKHRGHHSPRTQTKHARRDNHPTRLNLLRMNLTKIAMSAALHCSCGTDFGPLETLHHTTHERRLQCKSPSGRRQYRSEGFFSSRCVAILGEQYSESG